MAAYQETLGRIGHQLSAPPAAGPTWTPPAIGDLIKRIDAALRDRRAA